jgi:hypothetical protein
MLLPYLAMAAVLLPLLFMGVGYLVLGRKRRKTPSGEP